MRPAGSRVPAARVGPFFFFSCLNHVVPDPKRGAVRFSFRQIHLLRSLILFVES